MINQRKVLLWVGVVISIPATGYAGLSVVFYSWLSAAEPERWPAEKAAIWAGGALVLTVAFFILLIYCVKALVQGMNKEHLEEKKFRLYVDAEKYHYFTFEEAKLAAQGHMQGNPELRIEILFETGGPDFWAYEYQSKEWVPS
ncbi:MAG: hypothetical protein KZQ93_10405 [Candidatus Thiodiazotropha sp. (ex Monitilora ramsayi)]|nr:hypothetical protein [Candidatus Thiodiazotropha sp. (ex Monitilora ramsayi)]